MSKTKLRTHYCGELNESLLGERVKLSGWVAKQRNLGGLIFIDLRDRSGLVQLTVSPDREDIFVLAETLRNEFVVAAEGYVRKRPEGQANLNMKTGQIEIEVDKLTLLNKSLTPPFYIEDGVSADESLRYKYRYLDLRRPEAQQVIIQRHRIAQAVRSYLNTAGFIEVETPVLIKTTPEGARDYLVPSRIHPGEFYALPQSPQLLKQLLMIANFDRYYQLSKCFRDEDLRADRQPEFTQIDIEMSFVTQEEVREEAEKLTKYVCSEVLNLELKEPFPQITYDDAMNFYGVDKPDTRFEMLLQDISYIFTDSEFGLFKDNAAQGGVVKAIVIKKPDYSRKDLNNYTDLAKKAGAGGMIWLQKTAEGMRSSISKYLTESESKELEDSLSLEEGDYVFVIVDKKEKVNKVLGTLRLAVAKDLKLIPENKYNFLWVVDFPLLEYDEEAGRYFAAHHPFTKPRLEDLPLLETDPGAVRAEAYDLVLNGAEVAGGSIRIHDTELQSKMLKTLGFSQEQAQQQFGFLLNALQYGAPPHGGIAFGLDRFIMELLHLDNIKSVIAFPKTTSATDLMMDAPSPAAEEQLRDLHLKIIK